jgi:membrane protein implicated in regulation of membrane protease activity
MADEDPRDEVRVGMLGSVIRPVRGGRVPGEVRVVVAGMPRLYLAYCEEALDAATRVRVLRSRGARQIDVERWPRPAAAPRP